MTPEQQAQIEQAKRYHAQDENPHSKAHIGNLLALVEGLSDKAEVANKSAKQRFDGYGATEERDPIERLRFFCSLSMNAQDWLDVEPFFDALSAPVAGKGGQFIEPEDGWTFTDYRQALEFLSGRMKFSGISASVARVYAHEIDHLLTQAVVVPDKKPVSAGMCATFRAYGNGWNDCLATILAGQPK